jgi:alkyl sulfatase BDS1-like metallo-beta-lactamase superfamily hydrolase
MTLSSRRCPSTTARISKDAKRGFIATLPDGIIPGPGDKPAFDTKQYDF